jgi:hypothetical protein
VQFVERLKLEGAEWVRSQNFWLFGTATFKDGSRLTDSDASNDARHFFNILDRQILKRKETMQGRCFTLTAKDFGLDAFRYCSNCRVAFFKLHLTTTLQ